MNYSKLRSIIYGKFESQAAFSRAIKWHINKVNAMLNGRYTPSVTEAEEICVLLDLSLADACEIFFPSLSPFGDNERT